MCIDGTSNQFGAHNTNVIELYSQIVTSDTQLTYYNSGIGTYAKPSWKSPSYWKQGILNKIDLAIAWNFQKTVLSAYHWLSENYQDNDRIFLFGFSRDAYQVRTIAGMIKKVGLIRKGNQEQIPFAYELYMDPESENYTSPGKKAFLHFLRLWNKPVELPSTNLAERFKSTFSRAKVNVHFIGVWDTVSSIGIVRGRNLPLTENVHTACFVRHALALDECRVKFLPEYFRSESSDEAEIERKRKLPKFKEVWFPGTHSDM
ncbi:hypothetical protein CPB86DRAFT_777732 [Serendipita vermifera]|nr:hypothetical protein CPB86DRAFT_777732 [Serendipita vermifera]